MSTPDDTKKNGKGNPMGGTDFDNLIDELKREKSISPEPKGKLAKPKNLLDAFEQIVNLAEDSKLDDDFMQKASVCIKYAARKLKLSEKQVVLLSLFMEFSNDDCMHLSKIARYTGCRSLKLFQFSGDIDVLECEHYIIVSHRNNMERYRMASEAVAALRKNMRYVHVEDPIKDTADFFERFCELMDAKDDGELTYDSLMSRTKEMLEDISGTLFACEFMLRSISDSDKLLLIFMAHRYIEYNDDCICFHDIEKLFDDRGIFRLIKFELRNRVSDLFTQSLIENVNEDGIARPDAFRLTAEAKNEFLSELNLRVEGKPVNDLINHESFPEKKLIYNPSEETQISELASILSADRFSKVQSRLRKAGMRTGFCCLFYGSPGTGKTETVYQLARQTHRDIMRVDVDKIKSCWVGESEKNMKSLFEKYRKACNNSKLAPILLFNEADAVLGVRKEGASKAVDKMENSLQNIILQEMETIEGIMIATTNLTSNLDKAFERRFLYKIKYDRPTVESRARIWQMMLPRLKSTDAEMLAADFDLSGGEIENIVRKHTVNAILSGCDRIDLDAIKESCRNERIDTCSRNRVGF